MQTSQQTTQYMIPALGALYERCQQFVWPLFRVSFGAFFIPHGCQKLFGWWGGNIANTAKTMAANALEPAFFWAYYVGVLELVGGIFLVLGLLTRPVGLLFFGFMVVATFHVHMKIAYFWTARGVEIPMLLMLLALLVMIRGGGAYSLDRRIGREI